MAEGLGAVTGAVAGPFPLSREPGQGLQRHVLSLRSLCAVTMAPGYPSSRRVPVLGRRTIGSLHVGDLQAIVAFQAALLRPALGGVLPAVFVLKRAVVIVEIGVFAAEAPSYLSQGELRREG